MAGAAAPEVRFEDVMVHFSVEEWSMLEKWQQQLYFDVLMENYESLIIIGNPVTKADVRLWFKHGERQNCTESQESRASGDYSATDGGLGQIHSECYTKTLEPPKIVDGSSEEEVAEYGNLGLTAVPFMKQGSPLREECMPHLEEATDEPASPNPSQDAAMAPKPCKCQVCGLQKPSFPCPKCGVCVPSLWHMKKHQRIHSREEEMLHFCADCGESFRWYLDFVQHRKSHEEAKVWPCAQCSVTFTYRSDLVMHEESHFNEALCVCAPCGENCVCRYLFLSHFVSWFEKSMEERGTDSKEHEKLLWDVESKPEKPYSCNQCAEQFRLEENLEEHHRYCSKRQLKKRKYCVSPPGHLKDSDKQVWNRLVPKASRKGFSPPLPTSSARWACSHCSKSFTSQYILYKHRQSHKAEKCQRAATPNKSASPTSGLGSRSLVGVMKKLHKCQECRKSFAFKRQLVTHMKVHAEERRCQCTYCGETLGYQGRPGKQPRIHWGGNPPSSKHQKNFSVPPVAVEPRRQREEAFRQCPDCGKCLKKSYFPKHQAWHKGVRYECLLCGNVSSFKSGAHCHLLQHRKRKDFSACPKCGNGSRSKRCFCLIKKINLGQKPLPPL